MRIAFADFINWDFRVDTVYERPLGGLQSALCYLTQELAKLDHEVFLLTFTNNPGVCRGVQCLSLRQPLSLPWLQSLDAFVVPTCGQGRSLRPQLSPRTRLILWTGHAHDQGAVQSLRDPLERNAYDAFGFVSDWHRDQYHVTFGTDLNRSFFLGHAIGMGFADLFPADTSIISQKSRPPVLAYTSTPFRGLDVLLEIFPRIRAAVPGTTLKVISSMQVYQVPKNDDEAQFGRLYRLCHEIDGVEYVGSLPQPELVQALRSVSVLTYTNTFAETSCMSAMEAMASGCWIVTSDLAGLPQTTAGFGTLIPFVNEDRERYKTQFVEQTVDVLRKLTAADVAEAEAHLRRQVNYINAEVTWPVRARQWTEFLNRMLA